MNPDGTNGFSGGSVLTGPTSFTCLQNFNNATSFNLEFKTKLFPLTFDESGWNAFSASGVYLLTNSLELGGWKEGIHVVEGKRWVKRHISRCRCTTGKHKKECQRFLIYFFLCRRDLSSFLQQQKQQQNRNIQLRGCFVLCERHSLKFSD